MVYFQRKSKWILGWWSMPQVLTIRNHFAFGDTWPELTSFFVAESVNLSPLWSFTRCGWRGTWCGFSPWWKQPSRWPAQESCGLGKIALSGASIQGAGRDERDSYSNCSNCLLLWVESRGTKSLHMQIQVHQDPTCALRIFLDQGSWRALAHGGCSPTDEFRYKVEFVES